MDTCSGLAFGNASAHKGWVIGPLFQSFKSKMASFTEIVMSPVKLFRANSPPPLLDHQLDACEQYEEETCDVEHKERSTLFHTEGQSETGNEAVEVNQETLGGVEHGQNTKTGNVGYCKKILFDAEFSTHNLEKTEEYSGTLRKDDPCENPLPCLVPSNVAESVRPSNSFSSSHESVLISSDLEHQKAQLKPLPIKCTTNASEVNIFASKNLTSGLKKEESEPEVNVEQLSYRNSDESNKADSSNSDKTVPLFSSHCYSKHDCLQTHEDNNSTKMGGSQVVQQNLRNNSDESALECSGSGRAKRGMKSHCQVWMKREKLERSVYIDDSNEQELLSMTSDIDMSKGGTVSTNSIVDMEETLKTKKRRAVSTKAKGKGGQEMFPMVAETMDAMSESFPGTMVVCSLDNISSVSENNPNVCSSEMNPSGPSKRLKTRAGFSKSDVIIDNSMDLETTVAINSTNPHEQDLLPEVLVRPDIRLRGTSKRRETNKKPLKRKSPSQASSLTKCGSTLVSSSSVLLMDSSELTPTGFNASLPIHRESNQPSKRTRRGCRGVAQHSQSVEAPETKQCMNDFSVITKESQTERGKGKISTDPVYFEMTPFESNFQPVSSPPQPLTSCFVLLNDGVKKVIDEKEKSPASVLDEVFPPDMSVSRLRSSARRVNIRPRRADNQSRKSRVFHSRNVKGEEMPNSVTMEDADLATAVKRSSGNGFARRLLRSYSCPEIPSCSNDTPWTSHHSRTLTSHQLQSSHTPPVHKSFHRARRHTVCSIEVEREIAPLCLRKEVYPSRRSVPYDGVTHHLSPSIALSPSNTLSALASCFLSSPLAFLSKKSDSRGSTASPSTSSHVSSPTSSSSSPFKWHLPGFHQRTDSSHATLDSKNR